MKPKPIFFPSLRVLSGALLMSVSLASSVWGASKVISIAVRPIDLSAARRVSYTKQIKPLFADKCIGCHDSEAKAGGLDMSSVEAMRKGGTKAGPSLVPGKADQSTLVAYIRGLRTPQMPKGDDVLSEEQLHLLRQWIEAGAIDDSLANAKPIQSTTATSANAKSANKEAIDFTRDIQPILAASCLGCHGEEKHRGSLRLDVRALALQGGVSGAAIVPGHSDKSLLMQRIRGLHDEPRMPLNAPPLSEAQIATIGAWIDAGAPWPETTSKAGATLKKHWAYVKPLRPALPKVHLAAWVRNPIDNFVLAGLEKNGLRPSPRAAKETLLRRVSLDLIGLPPTPAEMDAFLADKSPDAYDRVVDRLLRSPHYGERWARPWLDLARYADTNGYEKDGSRTIWPYRDWVIQSLNADMPFDQWTIEQIAGDLLPGATTAQKVATGFHRNTMYNEEGGVDRAEQDWLTRIDRVNTTASVWLGSTMACAQCHNHKYDPISQKDYFRFLAFFDNADEPVLRVPTPDQLAKQAAIQTQIDQEEAKLKTTTAEVQTAQRQWEQSALSSDVQWTPLEVLEMSSAGGATLNRGADGSILVSGANPDQDTFSITVRSPLQNISAFRLEALPDASLPRSGPGRSENNGNFLLTDFRMQTPAAKVTFDSSSASFAQDKFAVADVWQDDPNRGWGIMPRFGEAHSAIFGTQSTLAPDANAALTITLDFASMYAQHVLGHFRLSVTDAAQPHRAPLPNDVRTILMVAPDARSAQQQDELAAYFRSMTPLLQPVRERVEALRKQMEAVDLVTTLVLQERAIDGAPSTDFHPRGAWLNKGERLRADVPSFLPPLPSGQPVNRLGLARWLVSRDNPLTARVGVNRMWEQFFGRGLVETSEDFGTQGDKPTHPELLDWLATEWMARGWKTKSLHRLIVSSATYRQSSRVSPALQERDPANKLLARGPRFRLEAEMIRDVALSASGRLSLKIGGPSVFPLQPAGVWDSPYSGERWTTSEGEDRFRRGLYTFLKRTAPYPTFASFDAPSREFCTVRRPRTNTPLQALTTLNDPTFIDAARGLAERVLTEAPNDEDARITYAFRLCLSRRPDKNEKTRLSRLYQQQVQLFSKDSEGAHKIAGSLPNQANPSEWAAWTIIANVLLNLDETLTKE